MRLSLGSVVAAAWLATSVLPGCSSAGPDDSLVGTDSDLTTGKSRRGRIEIIRDIARERGLENAVLLAGIAKVETEFVHCWSDATWACQGPNSPSCGGGPVIAGRSDGECALGEGGLGMFQFDGGKSGATLERDGDDILTIEGNVSHAVEFVAERLIEDFKFKSKDAAIEWMNGVKVADGDADFEKWKSFLACRYNGNCGSGKAGQAAKYGDATLEVRDEFGAEFWSKRGRTPVHKTSDDSEDSSDIVDDEDEVSSDDAPDSVLITWNKAKDASEYSLDIVLRNGDTIAPCVDVRTLGRKRSYRFDGDCVSPSINVDLADVDVFRICSAENDQWKSATCTDRTWNKHSSSLKIEN